MAQVLLILMATASKGRDATGWGCQVPFVKEVKSMGKSLQTINRNGTGACL